MKKKTLNKLVRDRIPNQIIQNGKSFKARKSDSFAKDLADKIVEEAKEVQSAVAWLEHECSIGPCGYPEPALESLAEEIADLLEVGATLCKQYPTINTELILKKVEEKRHKNGGFSDKIFLEWVEE